MRLSQRVLARDRRSSPRSAERRRRTESGAARGSRAAAATSRRGSAELRPAAKSPRRASASPTRSAGRRSTRALPRPPGRTARGSRASSKPLSRRIASMSAMPGWNSTPGSSSSQTSLYRPFCGRASRSVVFPSSGTHRIRSVVPRMNTSSPLGAQQARGLGDPQGGIAPDRRAVLGEREVERVVRQRHVLGVRLDQLQAEPELGVHPPRRVELRGSDVDADHAARAGALEPGAEVRRPAAELDHVLARDVGQDLHLALGLRPLAPGDLLLRPGVVRHGVRVLRVRLASSPRG